MSKPKMFDELSGGPDRTIEYCCECFRDYSASFFVFRPELHTYQATYLTALFLGMENIDHTEENLRMFLNLHRKEI